MTMILPLLGAFASGLFPALVAAALVFYAALPGTSVAELSMIASAAFFGKVVASACGGVLSDRLGRLAAIRMAGALSVAGSVLTVIGVKSVSLIVLGMGIEGFALGLFSILLPLHLIETQPVKRHGRASAEYQFGNTAGMLTGALVGMLVAGAGVGPDVGGRMDLLAFLPVGVLFFSLSCVRTGGARSRGRQEAAFPWRENVGALLKAVSVLSLTSAMGAGVIACHAVLLLQRSGLEGATSNGVYLLTGIVSLVAAGLSRCALQRTSRAAVLRVGGVGTAVSLVLLSIAAGRASPALVAACLLLYTGFFVFGPGVAAWTIAGEILPAAVRAQGMSCALLANQLVTAGLTAAFLPVAEHLGFVPIFLLFAAAAAAYCFLVRRNG